jgi:hypothetical protein
MKLRLHTRGWGVGSFLRPRNCTNIVVYNLVMSQWFMSAVSGPIPAMSEDTSDTDHCQSALDPTKSAKAAASKRSKSLYLMPPPASGISDRVPSATATRIAKIRAALYLSEFAYLVQAELGWHRRPG